MKGIEVKKSNNQQKENIPYVGQSNGESDLSSPEALTKQPLNFHIQTYGCQMNISDSEIVRSILLSSGHNAIDSQENADLVLLNTCAVRDNAENKVCRLIFISI